MAPILHLDQVWPLPLLAQRGPYSESDSEIWGTDCRFGADQRHLIIAPSGSGKSTFLHTIYGLRHDYRGEIELFGENLRKQDPESWSTWRQQRLSIVFQDLRLFPLLTARENLQLQMELSSARSEAELQDLVQHLGMADFLDRPVQQLSLGQQQRIALVRALIPPFDLLLLDEPFSHLDAENIQKAHTAIEAARSREAASLLLISLGDDYGLPFDRRWRL
ncbi:MAG: ATP-binding cassette domain-containing protein [Bacteroidota bacterium]